MARPKKITDSYIKSFPGASFDALVEDYFRRRGEPKPAEPEATSTRHSPAIVQLVYMGTTELLPGSVVVLTDPVETFEDNSGAPFSGLRFKCEDPATATLEDTFAITSSYIPAPLSGKKSMGFGYIPNSTWARVTINDAADVTAELLDADTLLSSTTGGRVPIIWKPTGTGVQWCVVQLPLLGGIRFARVTAEISEATNQLTASWGTGEVKLQHNSTGVLAADPITVDNLNIGTTFVVDAQVQVDIGYAIPRVLNGTCGAVSWS